MAQGIGRKFLNILGFVGEEGNAPMEETKERRYRDEPRELAPAREERSFFRSSHDTETRDAEVESDMKVTLLQPIRFEEAETIAQDLLYNRIVVFDLHNCDVQVATNIVNFVSGAVFALGGHIEKINDRGSIFVAAPPSVSLDNALRGGFLDSDYSEPVGRWTEFYREPGDF